jgi:O-antigen/teichoic acid export membrane protein
MSLARRLAGASLIYGLGDLLTRSASILLVPVYTRVLTPSDYGILSSVNMVSVVLGGFLTLSLNGALAKFHYEVEEPGQRRDLYGSLLLFAVGWGLLLTLGLNTIGGPLLDHVFRSVRFDPYLRLGTWIVLGSSLAALPLTMLQVQQRPIEYRILTTVSFLFSTGLIIVFVVVMRLGALGSLYGQLIAGAVMAGIYLLVMFRQIRVTVSWTYIKWALAFSLPLVVYAMGGWVTDLASRFFVERFTTLADLGLYNLANQYCLVLAMVFSAVNMAWLPLFYEIGKQEGAPVVFARYGLFLMSGALGLAVLFVVMAPDVFGLLTAPAFHSASNLVPILAATSVLASAVWTMFMNPLFLVKKTRHLIWLTAASGIVSVALNVLLTPRWGIVGAALAACLSYLVLDGLVFLVSIRVYPIPYDYRKLLLLTLLALGLCTVGVGLRRAPIAVSLAVKAVLCMSYAVGLFVVGVLRRADVGRAVAWVGRQVSRSSGSVK